LVVLSDIYIAGTDGCEERQITVCDGGKP